MIDHLLIFDREILGTKGSKSVISTSKIKKITAIKKNRRENGIRADPFGSKPHSKGEFFSRSLIVFFDSIDEIIISKVAIIKITEMKIERERIVFPERIQSC